MKQNKKRTICFIVTGLIIILIGFTKLYPKWIKTSNEYLNTYSVSRLTYSMDSLTTIQLIDSLIKIEKIYKIDTLALRHFDGQQYNDSIDRQWAIDLPMKNIKYLQHQIDTIVYKPNDSLKFAGLLISKIQSKTDSNQINYFGNGFICEKDSDILKFNIKGYRVTNSYSYKDCSFYMRKLYFQEMGKKNSIYNLDDIRFWNSKSIEY